MSWPSKGMPNHGVELIDGIPVVLKGNEMLAFQPGQHPSTPSAKRIKLGTYDDTTKKALWDSTEEMKKWIEDFQAGLTPRSRK
jgi:hypothetical protein